MCRKTYLAMFIDVLEGLDKAQHFINIAANGTIILGDLHHGACYKAAKSVFHHAAPLRKNLTMRIDDEETPERVTSLFDDNTIVPGHLLAKIRY